jgi:DNA-binding Lrp family transcriptional regulator
MRWPAFPPLPDRAPARRATWPTTCRRQSSGRYGSTGGVPVAAIAEKYGFTPQRVADGIAVLRDNGELGFRTDIARSLSGWPVSTWYFIEAPARTIELARTALSRVPEIRLAFTASSRFNLILFVWLKTLAEVNRFEIALENALAGVRIADRSVVLQLVKHLGRTVGSDTRVIGQAG